MSIEKAIEFIKYLGKDPKLQELFQSFTPDELKQAVEQLEKAGEFRAGEHTPPTKEKFDI